MKKKTFIISLIAILSALPLSGGVTIAIINHNFEPIFVDNNNGIKYCYSSAENSYFVCNTDEKFFKPNSTITIKDKVYSKPVTKIMPKAFFDLDIACIYIPSTVTYFANNCFSYSTISQITFTSTKKNSTDIRFIGNSFYRSSVSYITSKATLSCVYKSDESYGTQSKAFSIYPDTNNYYKFKLLGIINE